MAEGTRESAQRVVLDVRSDAASLRDAKRCGVCSPKIWSRESLISPGGTSSTRIALPHGGFSDSL